MGVGMTRMPLFAATLLCLSACGGGPSLGTATQKQLFLSTTSTSQQQMDAFQVGLAYDQSGGCMSLSGGAKAKVNGQDATVLERGGDVGALRFLAPGDSSGPQCFRPSFTFPPSMAGSEETEIVLEDGDARVTAVLRNLGATPAVTMTPPPDGHIRRGTTLRLTWTPASDDASQMTGSLIAPIPVGNATTFQAINGAAFQQGYTIPSDAPLGPALIQFSGMRTPEVLRCEGVDECHLGYFLETGMPALDPLRAAEVQINIEP
jgi:hypothetical protein